MKAYKKEIVYTMPYQTEAEIKKANDKRSKLYEKFNGVQVYPNGLYESWCGFKKRNAYHK